LLEAAREAIAGGAQMVQLREKEMGDRQLLQLADELRTMTRQRGTLFFVNDRLDVAWMCGADGVHLGQDDLPVHRARELLERAGQGHRLIGVSTHSLEQAREAAPRADYVAIGPIFPTRTKGYVRGLGPEIVRDVAAAVDVPVMAIGGITAENVKEVIAAGADAVAVCSSVVGAPDIRAATEKLLAAISQPFRDG
jgi:thiamine-phosphate pyrophosphorylase